MLYLLAILGERGESSITEVAEAILESIAAAYTVKGLMLEPVDLGKLVTSTALLYD